MKYQAIKHNKSGSRVLGYCDSLKEAEIILKRKGARFEGLSYIGGFPTFRDEKGKSYSIQGYEERFGVVCSIPQREIETFTF